jgi:nicotinamidase-related amidase
MMANAGIHAGLPLPPHFDPQKVDQIWRVPYEERAKEARDWAKIHSLQPNDLDEFKIALILIDIQNTFCIPGFELFVGGRSGTGAVDDNNRLVQFIYQNLGAITHISLTLDTHQATQIFHPVFLVDENGEHPPPYTLVTAEDIREGRWKFNAILAEDLNIDARYGQSQLEHYTSQLAKKEKFDLTIWPYHAMLGGIGHALVASIEEVVFFHTISRYSRPDFEIKGASPFTEHYSAIGPEVLRGARGESLGEKSDKIFQKVQKFDAVLLAGQAKSHCVAWTISDLLDQIQSNDPKLAGKVYLLEDCTSPVVVPGVIDYTDQSEAEFARYSESGMHIVKSSDPINSWPEIGS